MNSRSCVVISAVMVAFFSRLSDAADVRECAAIVQDRARLACYDAIFGRAGDLGSSAPTVDDSGDTALPDMPELKATVAVADFGLSERSKADRDVARARIEKPDHITATVEEIRERTRGEFVVRLDNGQVWIQTEQNQMARLNRGDKVTIRKAALGSYLLITPRDVATRVKRTE